MVSFPPPSKASMREFFSHIYCGNPAELLEVNLTNLWLPFHPLPFTGIPWSCPDSCFNDLLIKNLFSCPNTGFHSSFCPWISALVSYDLPYLLICLSSLGINGLPCVPPLSYEYKRRGWSFNLFGFSSVIRMKWQLLNSIPVEPDCFFAYFFFFNWHLNFLEFPKLKGKFQKKKKKSVNSP